MSIAAEKRFPNYLKPLQLMVRHHKALKEEPLHLAIYYAPRRQPEDVFLFEVLSHFGNDEVGEEGDFFEVTFGPNAGFPIEPRQRIHFILTNPHEFRVAFSERWRLALELRRALRSGKFHILYQDRIGKELLESVHGTGASVAGPS